MKDKQVFMSKRKRLILRMMILSISALALALGVVYLTIYRFPDPITAIGAILLLIFFAWSIPWTVRDIRKGRKR